jgi:deoxyribodipyrimidine photo-lyase
MTTLLWLRDDLRLRDHLALREAAASHGPLIVLYILENHPSLRPLGGASRWWLHHSLARLGESLAAKGQKLILRSGNPEEVLPQIIRDHQVQRVFWSRRYHALSLDRDMKSSLTSLGVTVKTFNSHLLLEPWEALKTDETPYTVYTPFWKNLFSKRNDIPLPLEEPATLPPPVPECVSESLASWHLLPMQPDWAVGLRDRWAVGEAAAQHRWQTFFREALKHYGDHRDRPDLQKTSGLSPHLRFGEISIRQLWHEALEAMEGGWTQAEVFLKELVWREFSYSLLYHNQDLTIQPFRPEFENFPWNDDPLSLRAWQRGQTGYPIVDAGMRELWQTGWMHNRVRMVTASFLTKHLLIPWQQGEAWFWDTLVDADPASNAASWQWVAGCGADAAPYFRIFNPILQGERFDPEGVYVKHYVPELKILKTNTVHKPWETPLGLAYPAPLVEHIEGRDRALKAYESVKKSPSSP